LRTSTATAIPERAHPAAGFSLVEVVVVLAVVALLASLVVPRGFARGADGLVAAADTLAARLAAARWQAVVAGRPVEVQLADLPPDWQVTEAGEGAPPVRRNRIAFAPLPAALPRTIALTDASGTSARIVIPAGLGPLGVAVGEAS
jgi:prepilin-type N-terminal cleavage/methylation domain-containing protein